MDAEALHEISKRSRSTPRTANYLLKRCRDYAQVSKKAMGGQMVMEALNLLEIDELGLSASDRKILEIMVHKFNGGPVGLTTIAAALAEEQATVEEVHEPYLIQCGLLERTPRGRVATAAAYRHLNCPVPEDIQNKLL